MPIREAIIPGAWSERITYSPAVRVGNLLFISGTTATDDNRQIVGVGDIVEQTRQIFRKFAKILAAAGASFDNVVETTDYFLTFADYDKTALARREVFRPPYPAATGVQVAGLIARRILCYVKVADVLARGQRYGFIRFGSRVDVYLPEGVRPLVAEGQTAIAGETVIADLQAGDSSGRTFRVG